MGFSLPFLHSISFRSGDKNMSKCDFQATDSDRRKVDYHFPKKKKKNCNFWPFENATFSALNRHCNNCRSNIVRRSLILMNIFLVVICANELVKYGMAVCVCVRFDFVISIILLNCYCYFFLSFHLWSVFSSYFVSVAVAK